jgi:hypothetical protein
MTRPSGTAIIDLKDQEIWETINVPPDAICKDFGYNPVLGTYSPAEEVPGLLIPTNQYSRIPNNVNRWMVGDQTDLIKLWNVRQRRKCLRFIHSQIDKLRTDIAPTVANNFVEVSPEIREISELNALFNDVLTISLSEISFLLDKEEDKLNYQINVKIEEDSEIPEWKETLISIKVQKRNPEDLIRLWGIVEERVRKKIESIKVKNEEEINKINENLAIVIEELD